mmetsp:Transcript_41212/g.46558  ORF Transcript_41212/g.46558 Transcript_41212/m.46558 type:complete len:99 (-) Transcript_41212:240-536(-)
MEYMSSSFRLALSVDPHFLCRYCYRCHYHLVSAVATPADRFSTNVCRNTVLLTPDRFATNDKSFHTMEDMSSSLSSWLCLSVPIFCVVIAIAIAVTII